MSARLSVVLTLIVGGLFSFFGCTDSLTNYDERESARTSIDGPKFRHAHLLERALKTNNGVGKSANNGNHLGLIIGVRRGLDKQRVSNRYKVASRYRVSNRYKIAQRYEYDHAMNGFAWTIEDSLGGDFQELFDSLAVDPDIEFFEPDIPTKHGPKDRPGSKSNSGQRVPPSIDRIGGHGQSDSDVDVFVLDTGVSNDDVDVVEEVDFTDSASGASDIDGHGTHIAGTIAAIDDNDGVVGVAPGARIHSLKVLPDFDPNPDDDEVDLSTAIAAVEHATGQKLANPNTPMVVNISLGADIGTTEYNALDEAIEASSAAGVVYVVAAGNEGIDASTVTPAHAASAITVGAYDPETDQFEAFSNYGSTVDILAPGVAVESLDKDDGQDEVQMSGTSMATAHVTGAVALFLEQNPQASPTQVREAIVASGLARIAGTPPNTTDKTIHIGDLMNVQVSPFYHYAIASDDDLKIEEPMTVVYDGTSAVNANLFSNSHIDLRVDGVSVEGFGYAHDDVKSRDRADAAFLPRFNPTNLPGYYKKVDKIDIPDFRPQDYQHLATQQSNDDVNLAGHYDLGTASEPMVWYIDGKLKTLGDVSFSGYGILLVKDDVEIKHNVTIQGAAGDTNIGIYTGKDFKIKKDAGQVNLVGHLVAREDVVIEGDLHLTGSITAGQKAEFKRGEDGQGSAVIRYRPPSSVLLNLIWPMNAGQ